MSVSSLIEPISMAPTVARAVHVSRRLRILAPTRYPWRFNGPRRSRHDVSRRAFIPFNKISPKIEGFTAFNPLPIRHFDLIHAFNRIPLGRTPFVIGFESHMPRAFGIEGKALFRMMSGMLASTRCRGIVAISDHAADIVGRQHAGTAFGAAIGRKLIRRYPNIELGPPPDLGRTHGRPLRVSFVGNHFARKGGCVAVKVAEMAAAKRLPVEFHVVSALEVGGSIWTDPAERSFFSPYLALLDLPNVRWSRHLPNGDVQKLFRESDVSLLTTLGDTCGFGAIESMAQGTPVIATSQGALPEFIDHGTNGFLLPIPVDERREWVHLGDPDRRSKRFEGLFATEVDALARQTFALIAELVDTPGRLASLRYRAYDSAKSKFGSEDASLFWDEYYEGAVNADP